MNSGNKIVYNFPTTGFCPGREELVPLCMLVPLQVLWIQCSVCIVVLNLVHMKNYISPLIHCIFVCSFLHQGTCCFRNTSGGPTLALEIMFHSVLNYCDSNYALAKFSASIEKFDGKKTYVCGGISDGEKVIASARGLWRNMGWQSDEQENEVAQAEKLKSFFRSMIETKPPPQLPISDQVAIDGRSRHMAPTIDLAEFMERETLESVTSRVFRISGQPQVPHYIRASGKIRLEYFWSSREMKFQSIVQFSGWCQGPPGMVHGGAVSFNLLFCCTWKR
jgi:hypothetical protein